MQALQWDTLLRPCFIPPYLTGAVYHDFFPELLQGVDLQTRIHKHLKSLQSQPTDFFFF